MIYDAGIEIDTLKLMLKDQKSYAEAAISLKDDDFYDTENQKIFQVIKKLNGEGKKIDLTFLNKECEKIGIKGVFDKIIKSVKNIYSPEIISHIEILKELSQKRKYETICLEVPEMIKAKKDAKEIEDYIISKIEHEKSGKFHHIKDVYYSTLKGIDQNTMAFNGIKSGFKNLDDIIIGFHYGDVCIIAANTSMGKTAFSLKICYNVAKANIPVGIFSMEMEKEELIKRIMADEYDVFLNNLEIFDIPENKKLDIINDVKGIKKLPVFIDDSPGTDINTIISKIKLMVIEHDVKLVMIDHLGYIRENTKYRHSEVEKLMKMLKSIAKELKIVILPLSQLHRPEGKLEIPQLSHLRDSGAIEEDSDKVFMLWREDYTKPDTPRKGLLDVFIRKNRGGITDDCVFRFIRGKMRFEEIIPHKDCMEDNNEF